MKYDNVLDSTSQYGPQGLLGRDGLLSTGYWANTQANILTGTGLPVSNEEMKTYLNLPDNVEIPQDFQKLYDVYNEYKQLCDWWIDNLFSCVLNMVNDINNVGSFASSIINDEMKISLQVMANDSDEQGRQEAAKRFQSACSFLAGELNQQQQYLKRVQSQLNSLLQGSNNCIGVRQLNNSFEEVMAYLDSQYNSESEIHNLLNMFLQIKKLLGEIVEEHDINEKVKFSSELGPLIGFIVSEMLEYSDVQLVKQKNDQFQNMLKNMDAQLSLVVKVLSLFHSINIDLNNVIARAERSMEFVGQIEGNWHSITNQFYSLAQGFENEDINKLSTDLDNAASTWEAVANKAKEFVANSYQG
ncbi:toxin [Bacillus spizizenii]|nr:toxin [Bacillus spizizenii]